MDAISSGNGDYEAEISAAEAERMRAEPRDSMLLTATLRRASGIDVAIKVRNLSSGGLMAEVQAGLLREERVEVDLRGIGIVPGRVAWVAGGRAGVAFDHAVDHKKARKPITAAPDLTLFRAPRTTAWRPGLR